MKRKMILMAIAGAAILAVALVPGTSVAQPPPGAGMGRGGGPGMGPPGPGRPGPGMDDGGGAMQQMILKHLYPLEMVRRHADEIELTEEQMEKLRDVVTSVNAEVEQLKWDLAKSSRKLVKIIENGATKEQVYAQMDVIFKFENKIKKKHLGLMIVVRDILTKQQRSKLDDIKEEVRNGERRGRGMGQGRAGPYKDPWRNRR